MSVIGPRPLLVEYLPYYTKEEHHRHDVRPGLSGWAQINGRNAIDSWEQRFQYDLYNTAALTELPIGDSKADFIMINGRGVVYEIKTDLDNLIRLENQLKDYYKVFSYIYVVVGNKQLPHVKEFLKDQKVGIYELTASGRLICRKKAFYNRDNLSYGRIFRG